MLRKWSPDFLPVSPVRGWSLALPPKFVEAVDCLFKAQKENQDEAQLVEEVEVSTIRADQKAMRFVGGPLPANHTPGGTSEPGLDLGGDRSAGADFARTGGSPRCGVLGRGGGCRAKVATCQYPGGTAGGAADGTGALSCGATAGGCISPL